MVPAVVAVCLGCVLVPAGTAQAACANEAIRQAQVSEPLPGGTAYLPDCMALEMVSPPVKRLQTAISPTFSANGERVKFLSQAALAETPGLQGLLDSYVATRTVSGWTPTPTSPPALAEIAGGGSDKGAPYAFAADLGRWDLIGATQAQLQTGSGQVFQGGLDGTLSPLSPVLVPIDNSGNRKLNFDTAGAESTGSSADLSTTIFHPEAASTGYLAGDPLPPPSTGAETQPGGDFNTYVASRASGGPSLELLARDREGRVYGGRCGTHLGGGTAASSRGTGRVNQGAISPDGQRIYFSARPAQPPTGPCGASGVATTIAGSNLLSGLYGAKGSGTLTAGSTEVSGLAVANGEFQPGQEIAGTGVAAGTTIIAVGQGTLTLSAPATASGATPLTGSAFAAGQGIAGAGIPAGASLLSTGPLSVAGQTATLSATATETQVSALSAFYPLRILRRTVTGSGPEIAPLIAGETESGWQEPGSDFYQGASVDGSKTYFTSSRKLTSADHDPSAQECSAELGGSVGCDLYLYDSSKPSSQRLTDVSAGTTGDPTPGEGADVLGSITAISGDGTRVYFVAQGKLTSSKDPEGAEAVLGAPNLYTFDADTGTLSFVGTLSPEDKGKLWGVEQSFVGGAYAVPSIGPSEAVGGDGHILVFATHASLAAEDTDGGYSDIYRYDADTETLTLISRAAPGGSESPPADVEVNPNGNAPNANPFEEGRWVSEDGETIAFATAEPLVAGDADGAANPYLWKGGQLARLPGRLVGDTLPTVSPSGSEVGFTSEDRLLPADGDSAPDVYVARAGGGFPIAQAPVGCDALVESSCRALPSAPGAVQPASSTFGGPGNPKPPSTCKKRGFVRRHARCVRKRDHKRHGKHHKHGKRRHGKGSGKH